MSAHPHHHHPAPAPPGAWRALALLAVAQFMVILDITVVNVALPSIGADLAITGTGLQWVVTAYTLTLGGLLLLGGRAADAFGRRRTFVAGLLVFTGASLAAGVAESPTVLLAARVAQGIGAAALSPSALSLIAVIFPAGPDRHRALGVWGAIGAVGAAVGVLVGGVLTDAFGWSAVFLVNVPVGLAAALLARRVLPAAPAAPERRSLDVLGAALATGALLAVIYAIAEAPDAGWGSLQTLALVAAGLAALVAFVAHEARTRHPIVELAVVRRRSTAGALLLMLVAAGTLVAASVLVSLHLQQGLGHSALRTGLEMLPVAVVVLIAAHLGAHLLGRVGARAVVTAGMLLATAGAAVLTQLDADASYAAVVLPGYGLLSGGMGLAFVAVTVTALAHATERDAGLLSGLTNTAHELGATLLVSVLSSVAVGAAASGTIVAGAGTAFVVAAGVTTAGALAALALLPRGVPEGAAGRPVFAH